MKNKFKNYLSLIKFSHTIFALPFAIIGFSLASVNSDFNLITLLQIILCMIFARSSAMAFNRYIDREIDLKNPRTANVREIPSGKISPKNALLFVIINVILFVVTTYFINDLCLALSPVALLVILGYSYTKRFTSLCHLVLGVGLGLAPVGAYLAVANEFNWIPVVIGISVMFWVAGFDIIYALQDDDFDKENNLNSIPVLLGRKNALLFSKILHIFTSINLFIVGYFGSFEIFYWIGFVIFSALLSYQHRIIKHNDLSKVGMAFFTTNGLASILFGILVVLDIFLK
ncbi:putative 4-hydroxybenzoate polyprenyltransferase [Flavobacteriales bacterium]|nr:putative 4-hydroxybenzoate polyprenyltransferase [Flavobacteriales bacterium]